MPSQSTHYKFDKPTVGGDADTWGTLLNNNMIEKADGQLARPQIPRTSPAVGATTTCDLSTHRAFLFTITQNTSVVFSNFPTVDPTVLFTKWWLILSTDAAFDVTWPAEVLWHEANKPDVKVTGTFVIEFAAHVAGTIFGRVLYQSVGKQFPRVAVTHSVAQLIDLTDALTPLAMDTETMDTHAMHDTVTNNSRLTVPAGHAGAYRIVGSITSENDAVVVTVAIRKNGTTILKTAQSSAEVINSGGGAFVMAYDAAAIAGDYYELCVDNFGNTNDYTIESAISGNPAGTALLFAAERIA